MRARAPQGQAAALIARDTCAPPAAGAVGVLDISLLLYPIYFCLVNGAIALLIHQRRCCRTDSPDATAW